MSMLYVHVLNSQFESRDQGLDYDRPEVALAMGIEAAVGVVGDEIRAGKSSSAAVVTIERADGTPLCRSVVAFSVSPLLLPPVGTEPLEIESAV